MFDLNLFPHPLVGTPFGAALDLAIVIGALALGLSLLTREYSWADRFWSMAPPIYCLVVAAGAGFESARLNLMTVLVTLWGVRLSYNFWRKGGFKPGGEDYRWAYLRERMGELWFQVMNCTFTSFGQMLLVWLFTSPIHHAWLNRDAPLNWIDALAAGLFLALLLGETVADQQQWNFHQDKKRRIAAGAEITAPFLTTGLFSRCRHPNLFCELGMWWVFYLFAVAASGSPLHWSLAGAILLNLLFLGSTRLTESISLGKYPSYREYQQRVPALIPIKFGRAS
ncbi:MAG: DUF1295 domain-containing protein [Gammaproteobacteria bacterium]|nr:DUF1295 domain-containing protein [Gammaproteobacteria bacterium]MCY4297312.1 DUF1295 domain-containing protein [Gammaproteobacteria bacterium]